MKLIVTGYAGHGKDTVCSLLQKHYGFSFESSSMILLKEVIFPVLAPKYGYLTEEDCYLDRVNHRQEWFELLKAYNSEDKAKLGKLIFTQYDIYCGLRNIEELEAMQSESLYDYSIWVDASKRLPPESRDSMTITKEDCDIVLDNNGSQFELFYKVKELVSDIEYYTGMKI